MLISDLMIFEFAVLAISEQTFLDWADAIGTRRPRLRITIVRLLAFIGVFQILKQVILSVRKAETLKRPSMLLR